MNMYFFVLSKDRTLKMRRAIKTLVVFQDAIEDLFCSNKRYAKHKGVGHSGACLPKSAPFWVQDIHIS